MPSRIVTKESGEISSVINGSMCNHVAILFICPSPTLLSLASGFIANKQYVTIFNLQPTLVNNGNAIDHDIDDRSNSHHSLDTVANDHKLYIQLLAKNHVYSEIR